MTIQYNRKILNFPNYEQWLEILIENEKLIVRYHCPEWEVPLLDYPVYSEK